MSESLYCRTCAGVSRLRMSQTGGALVPLISRLLTLAGIVVLTGLLPWLSGGDPALSLLRARSGEQEATAETLGAIRQSLGLDNGPWFALTHWLNGLLHGDAGVSWVSGLPVLPGMLQATGVSLTLMASSAGVAFILALLLCAGTMVRGLQGRTPRPAGFTAALFTALPEFLLASVLLIVGAVWLSLFPPYGWQGWHYAVLPSLALGIPAGGYLGRIYSDALCETFKENWLTTWSVLGIQRRHTALAVVCRTLPGVMPLTGLVLVSLTGGAVAVETVFAAIAAQLERIVAQLGAAAAARICGIGVAAPLSFGAWEELLRLPADAALAWSAIDIRARLQASTSLPVTFAKDTAAACVAELVAGRGRRLPNYLYLFIDTLTGGGLVLNGQPHAGRHGNAGAIGSMPMHAAVGGQGAAPDQLLSVASLLTLPRQRRRRQARRCWRQARQRPWRRLSSLPLQLLSSRPVHEPSSAGYRRARSRPGSVC